MALCLALLPQAAEAEEVQVGNLTFDIVTYLDWIPGFRGQEGHIAEVTKATLTKVDAATSGTLTVPATVMGADGKEYPVTTLGSDALQGCSELTAIALPQSLTGIGGDAFRDCPRLATISVADGNRSFKVESGLLLSADGTKLVAIPGATQGTLTLPASVTGISPGVLTGYPAVSAYAVEEGNTAFVAANGLLLNSEGKLLRCPPAKTGTVTIPAAATSIEYNAFDGCQQVSAFAVEEGNTAYSARDGLLLNADGSALERCPMAREGSLELPATVTHFSGAPLKGCQNLTAVTLPEAFAEIELGNTPFDGCPNLLAINVAPGNPTYKTVDGMLLSRDGTQLVFCPQGKSGVVTVPAGVEELVYKTFLNCPKLTKVELPAGLTFIGPLCFWNCSALTAVNLPESLERIYASIFSGCDALRTVQLPSSLTSIGNSAFRGWTGLEELTVPPSVTKIEVDAFSGCTSLARLTLPYGVELDGSSRSPFEECTSLRELSVTYPAGQEPTEADKAAYLASLGLSPAVTQATQWRTAALRPPLLGSTAPERTGSYDLLGRRVKAGHRGLTIDNGRLSLRR